MLAARPDPNLNKSLLFNPHWGHLGPVPEGEASECLWAAGFGHQGQGGTGRDGVHGWLPASPGRGAQAPSISCPWACSEQTGMVLDSNNVDPKRLQFWGRESVQAPPKMLRRRSPNTAPILGVQRRAGSLLPRKVPRVLIALWLRNAPLWGLI